MKSDLSEKVPSGLLCYTGCMVLLQHSERQEAQPLCRHEKKVSQAPAVSLLQLTNKSKLFLSVSISLNKDCWNLSLLEKRKTKQSVK